VIPPPGAPNCALARGGGHALPLLKPPETGMAVITCIDDLRQLARRRVPRMFYDYADGGSWIERTCRA
jgi:hypothetical protein